MCASRERGTVLMVGPLYRDPRPAAQLLISSTAHQSLVHDPPSRKVSLSLSLLAPISQPQTWPYPSRAISRTPMVHEARRKEGGTNAFIYALGFERSSRSKVDEDRRGVEERERRFDAVLTSSEPRADEIKSLSCYLRSFALPVFEVKSEH